MQSPLADRSILCTGGSGFFGQAFVRRALDEGARRVVVFSRSEAKQAEMRAEFADDRLRFALGDVRDAQRILDACRGIEIVVHAAAQKRVEQCESDPSEAAATNITGTLNTARACIERGVTKALLLSTDKAAAPNTLYGATKLAAERLWAGANVYAAGTPTRFATTRYGNVLGSTGSVIPTWRAQMASGELTVTDSRMTRFFMSIEEAVDLVVLALGEMRSGSIYVPKIRSASILALATAVAPDCVIRGVGIRPGEKLHETLVTEDEARSTYEWPTHFVIEPDARTWGEEPRLFGLRVPAGFTYRSDTAQFITPDRLRELVAA